MMISTRFVLIALVVLINNYEATSLNNEDHHMEYTREWAVKVSDPLNADLIALETGFENKGPVSTICFSTCNQIRVLVIRFSNFYLD